MSGPLTWQEGDRLLDRLIEARDTLDAPAAEAFLARLVLLLANEVGDLERLLVLIDEAADAPPPAT